MAGAASIVERPPSRLVLGTAQLGSAYGIANRTGLPPFEAIRDIIRRAWEGGVDLLDTAPAYFQSEDVVGRALRDLGLQDGMRVVTKAGPFEPALSSRDAVSRIEESVAASLRRLGLDHVAACLFHREEDISWSGELLALKGKGLIGEAGISLVHPEAAWKALKIPEMKVWQIPSNVLDRRFTHSGLTAGARAAGITVLVRSIYLQGLLLMDDAATPAHLREVIPARQRVRDVARRFGLPVSELAMRAPLSRPDIRSVVVGMETSGQVDENAALFAKGPLPAEVVAALEALPLNLPQSLLSPPEWPKRAEALKLKEGRLS